MIAKLDFRSRMWQQLRLIITTSYKLQFVQKLLPVTSSYEQLNKCLLNVGKTSCVFFVFFIDPCNADDGFFKVVCGRVNRRQCHSLSRIENYQIGDVYTSSLINVGRKACRLFPKMVLRLYNDTAHLSAMRIFFVFDNC